MEPLELLRLQPSETIASECVLVYTPYPDKLFIEDHDKKQDGIPR